MNYSLNFAETKLAGDLLRKAYGGYKRQFGVENYNTLHAGNLLGNVVFDEGDKKEALRLWTEAHYGFLKLLGPDDYLTTSTKLGMEMCGGAESILETFSTFNEALQSQVRYCIPKIFMLLVPIQAIIISIPISDHDPDDDPN